ncbi:MAG: DUF1593 domain-containing protein [Bryobacteraceae bacterium]
MFQPKWSSFVLFAAIAAAEPARLVVLTDITSLTTGVGEPDDGQSLIRLLLFTNEIEIEGLVATSNMRHGAKARPELIREAIAAYAQIRPNLLLHDHRYPEAAQLESGVKMGQPVANTVGPGLDTEGSRWIVECALRKDRRPLWITVWGGTTDLAQALLTLRETPAGRAAIARLRIHAIGDQDKTGPAIRQEYPELFYIHRKLAYRGMYRYGDTELAGSDWVETNVRNGHGVLGALYPNYNGGDIFVRQLGRVRGVKEGDTPSYLNLIDNGLDPLDGWGGRVVQTGPNRYEDEPSETPWDSVLRWREAYQAEFAARLDWCVKPFQEANHAPVVKVRRKGDTLDASGSTDPDTDPLTFEWEVDGVRSTGPNVRAKPGRSVRLTVRDSGTPPLSRYWRSPR